MDEKTTPGDQDDRNAPAGPDDETVPAYVLRRAAASQPADKSAPPPVARQDARADLEPGAPEATAVEGNRSILEDLAMTVRRVEADESFDGEGIRTVWHQGRMHTELLSWENRAGLIVKQELSFLGVVVEYRQGKPIRTGTVQDDDLQTGGGGRSASSLVEMDATPAHQTLDDASHLLKHVPGRDYYAQHLLKHVNDGLSNLDLDEARTVVSSLEQYSKNARSEPKTTQSVREPSPADRTSTRVIVIAILGTAAVLASLGIGLLLW